MRYKIDNITLFPWQDEGELLKIAAKAAGEKPGYFRILKKSLDARKKTDIKWIYSIEFSASSPPAPPPLERAGVSRKIMIAGGGPAGLFCALRLLERGLTPVIIERGGDVDARSAAVKRFSQDGILDTECNVQFGEGGAGTFSDGKLNTQTHSGYNRDVLKTFAALGAPAETEYLNKPHIGSDRLKAVIKNMRRHIIISGGEVRFNTKLTDIISATDGRVRVLLEQGGAAREEEADGLVLALGHSARDTFAMLRNRGFAMERREFSVGVRIEHLQSEINAAQYGGGGVPPRAYNLSNEFPNRPNRAHQYLPPADYKLVSNASSRTAFTFCNCPGGFVMPAASENGGVVTNGMSNYSRDGVNANSAVLVQIRQADFGSEDLFAGIEFQRRIERAAYDITGGYAAPVQLVGDFLRNRESAAFGGVLPTYPKTVFCGLRAVLPKEVTAALSAALPDMAKRLKGFDAPDAVLTAPETRFSSPIRILRNEQGESVTHNSVYPCGEGSGYSGGITSSAADGLRIADNIFNKYS